MDTLKTAVVTGAGSGVGRAVTLQLARAGWTLALIGRRLDSLRETVNLAAEHAPQLCPIACDIADAHAVRAMGESVLARLGPIEVLINAAGTNTPRRALEVLSLEDYHALIATNLHGAYYCTQAFLPSMRARGSGSIIHIVSDAARQASPKAGPAYVMSKFGLAGLTQSINAEERSRGIRACAILPGDIDTPLLNKRPHPPDEAARRRMMRPEDVAECVMLCLRLPPNVIVEELLVRPR